MLMKIRFYEKKPADLSIRPIFYWARHTDLSQRENTCSTARIYHTRAATIEPNTIIC